MKMRIYFRRFVLLISIFIVGLYLNFYVLVSRSVRYKDLAKNRLTFRSFLLDTSEAREESSAVTNFTNGLSAEFRKRTEIMNRDLKVLNADKFQFKLDNDSVVILIQVHSRLDTLKAVIESLRSVRYINETLVIFSHDVLEKDILQAVQSIDFCPVLQISYPYSVHIYPFSFPGTDPNDCRRNDNKTFAKLKGCNSADHPDMFKHYREAHVCQMKHHWLWKMHFVFDRMNMFKSFHGMFLRLDDDYYLSYDVIHVIRKLNSLKRSVCRDCKMFVLGDHEGLRGTKFQVSSGLATMSTYYVGLGRGMAIGREFWEAFRACSTSFCTYDEYNWDFALHHTAATCMLDKLKVLKPIAGRVFHIGWCRGFHRHSNTCSIDSLRRQVKSLLDAHEKYLFPEKFSLSSVSPGRSLKSQYGGWGDPRDHQLCLSMFSDVDNDKLVKHIHDKFVHKKKGNATTVE